MGRIKRDLPSGLQFDGKNYIVDKWVDQTRIKKRLGPVTRKEAEEKLAELITDAKRGELVSASASSLTVYEVIKFYHDKHLLAPVKPGEKIRYHIASGKDLRYHIPVLDRLIGNYRVMDLKLSDIEDFQRLRGAEKTKNKDPKKRRPIAARTIQAELQLLTMAIRYAVKNKKLPHNPVEGMCGVKVPRKPIVVLDDGYDQEEEWLKLYAAMPDHWKLFMLIEYEAAMRPSEVKAFQCEWVHPVGDNWMILIPGEDEKTDAYYRRIPVSKRLEQDLIPAVTGKTGDLFKHKDYNKAIRRAIKESGINPNVRMKSLRKTRISIWDAIDSNASRVASGHVPKDVHEESYARVNDARLFKLVGIEIDQKFKIYKQA